MPLRTGRRDWLWGVTLGAVALILAGGAFLIFNRDGVKTHAEIDGVKCQTGERLEFHVHSHLSILIEGAVVPVPANIGVREDCLFWLHTHTDDGLLHVEAPDEQDFTLGQFFAVWGQPLSESQLLDRTVDGEHEIRATVDGEPFVGDPATIVLEDQQTIVLQYGPPFAEPPESPFEDETE